MPKLYANMTLSSLHSRKVIVRPEVIAVPSAGGVYTTSTYGNRGQNAPGVFVNVETTETRDYNLKDEWDAAGSTHGAESEKSHTPPPSNRRG